ncbi:MAG: hydroxymethylglutaryl-CoA lyase [Phycisphaerales bacterium]|nr:hydroxymethylglutaryl-CoA lyase [Phycisphaerales bacterium]
MASQPEPVRIVEVGPRDGLQNEPVPVPTATKRAFVERLVAAGLREIEVTSFVHPKLVPQLADAAELCAGLPAAPGVRYSALAPNEKGLERALAAGVQRVAVFTAASETFAQRNINMSIDESLRTFAEVARRALAAGVSVRGYLSTCFVCPFEGHIAAARVLDLTHRLLDIGCDEVAISDTIGAAAPCDVAETVGLVLSRVPAAKLALHFHDTYGTALANVVAGLQLGIRTFDASAGGLGGCPFAPGAAGNLATEDLVYLLERMGHPTGVRLDAVVAAAGLISQHTGRPLASRNARRLGGDYACAAV